LTDVRNSQFFLEMSMNRVNRIGLVTAIATLSAIAGVQAATVAASQADATKAIKDRQAIFKEIKDLNEPLGKMLRRQAPMDPALVATNAAKMQALAGKIAPAFAVDTRTFKATETAALDGIWNSEADFKGKADAMAKAAGDAVTAGKSGDAGATNKALQALGKSCGGCHDAYKASTK
jgi:cytochrome c556